MVLWRSPGGDAAALEVIVLRAGSPAEVEQAVTQLLASGHGVPQAALTFYSALETIDAPGVASGPARRSTSARCP
jgi:hypothetical protein